MIQKKGRKQLKDLAGFESSSPNDRKKMKWRELGQKIIHVYTPGSCIDIAGDWAAVHARQLDDIMTERVRGWTRSLSTTYRVIVGKQDM